MNQLITIAKIGGEAAKDADRLFAAWERDPNGGEVAVHQTSFLAWLEENANQPPVLFYCRYVDLWAMGDVFRQPFMAPGCHLPRYVANDSASLEFLLYSLPDDNALSQSLKRRLQDDAYQLDEARLYDRILREAAISWSSLVGQSVLIVVRMITGGLVTDEEVLSSLRNPLGFVDGK